MTAHSLPDEIRVDVVIIGAGASGCAAAAAMAEAGHEVALIDLHEHYPADFRSEKIGERQMKYLDDFGLGAAAREHVTTFDCVWVHRYGSIIDKQVKREFASSYGDFVNALRGGLPEAVKFIVGRVDAMDTSDDLQTVTLADGRRVTGRLLVLATGLIDVARRKLGMEKQVLSAGHSLIFGFDLANTPDEFPCPSVVWFLDRPADQGAYFTIFPIGHRLRANLFTYRELADPWVKRFRLDPANELHAFLPDFERHFPRIRVDGSVSARPVDLTRTQNCERPGVVLIGDAYFTSCPVTGTGIDKALHDVERLVSYHLPIWLATPGMGLDKIAAFYADPLKREHDQRALQLSLDTRTMRMDLGWNGRLQRLKNVVRTQGRYRLRALAGTIGSRAA